jgi:predicted 3-demethylubiquinone-9 3-methyltransferase (glyoxalase superfamily)
MNKIIPHLWFDKEAKEAAEFYVSALPDSRMTHVSTVHDTPSGDADMVSFELAGSAFMAISAGPLFTFNPSISFLVVCATSDEVDELWAKFIEGGSAQMELGTYPFSKRYGWLQDNYGLSWQFMQVDEPGPQKITPTLMFVGDVCGKAEEAMKFYTSVFHDAKVDHVMRYEAGDAPDKPGTVRHEGFTLEGQYFGAMDSARMHEFGFNEAISLLVKCKDQSEIDYYWEKLSAVPGSEQCGWLKDKYGVSWQIAPTAMDEMMTKGTPEQVARVTKAFLKMKKFDVAELEAAYEGK